MKVSVLPWKELGRWMVYARTRLPDGRLLADRKVISARTEASAIKWGELHLAHLIADANKPRVIKSKVPTFAAEASKHLAVIKARKKLSSADAIASQLANHVLPFIGHLALDKITNGVLDELRVRWAKADYQLATTGMPVKKNPSPKSVFMWVALIATILRRAVANKDIPHLPCDFTGIGAGVTGRKGHHLGVPGYQRLVAAAATLDPRILAVVLAAGDAGLRRNEILALERDDVDMEGAQVHVRRNVYFRHGVRIVTTCKGGKEVSLPCTPRLLEALRVARGHLRGPILLYADDGQPVTPKTLRRWIERAEHAAGLPVTGRLHHLRHTFITALAEANVPMIHVQKLARHSDVRITQLYCHPHQDAMRDGAAALTAFYDKKR